MSFARLAFVSKTALPIASSLLAHRFKDRWENRSALCEAPIPPQDSNLHHQQEQQQQHGQIGRLPVPSTDKDESIFVPGAHVPPATEVERGSKDGSNSSSKGERTEEKDSNKIDEDTKTMKKSKKEGMRADAEGDFHGLFPMRQLWQPALEYPLWDPDWDGQEPETTGDEEEDRRRMRQIRKTGVTRHIILIRHGQYDESHKEDEKRVLTALGKEQAEWTGKRLAELLEADDKHHRCNIKTLRVSGMKRAIQTAEIISAYLPNTQFLEPDPLLNEGRPCHTIPTSGMATEKMITATDANHPRIEEAFRKYFYRKPYEMKDASEREENADHKDVAVDVSDEKEHHEYEIIVCHANVIRYFVCRALQIPPEAWLRFCPFNCSLTYLTIRPTGGVSCRLIGDIGHLPYRAATFSGHHGFNW